MVGRCGGEAWRGGVLGRRGGELFEAVYDFQTFMGSGSRLTRVHGKWFRKVTHGKWFRKVTHGKWFTKVTHGKWLRKVTHGKWFRKVTHGKWIRKVTHGK